MHKAIMEASDISFFYKDRHILKNISLKINAAEVFSIIGPNGAGKTTLLNCLLDFIKPASGKIFLNGKPVNDYRRSDFCRIVSFVPQMHRPVFNYTVEEIVLMGKNPHLREFAVPSQKERDEVSETLEELKISHLKKRHYTKISGGELRMVLIARALVQASRVIIMDEPAAHLDIKNQLDILELIKKMAVERKTAVVMVVHDPAHALLYSDRIMLLKDGENIASGKPDEIVTPENLSSVYGVETKIIEFEGRKIVVPIKSK